MKRGGLLRRTSIRRRAPSRGGLMDADRAYLKFLHRVVVMLRAGAALFIQGEQWMWRGRCLKCRMERWLQVSHICPKGEYRALEFDPANAFALCWRCHMHWWHKNPEEARRWAIGVMGQAAWDRLWLRARVASRPDWKAVTLALAIECEQMAPGLLPSRNRKDSAGGA